MEPDTTTVFAAIGNSDDKLTQWQWSEFVNSFVNIVRIHASKIHGEWVSESSAPFQNACMCFEITEAAEPALRWALAQLRATYLQDSLAWSVVSHTDFI